MRIRWPPPRGSSAGATAASVESGSKRLKMPDVGFSSAPGRRALQSARTRGFQHETVPWNSYVNKGVLFVVVVGQEEVAVEALADTPRAGGGCKEKTAVLDRQGITRLPTTM
jgi:hypothetical protein